MNAPLSSPDNAATAGAAFYDERYAKGYLEEWPERQLQRIDRLVRELDLPLRGRALDFGCGTGVFTAVLKNALPGWELHGLEISSVAVRRARDCLPECTFFVEEDEAAATGPYDFVFTHHVLEHVADLDATWARFAHLSASGAFGLHVLPCGNPGSLEHRICALRVDGVRDGTGGTFFYEDPSHVRRLTTEQLAATARRHGFHTRWSYCANRAYGAADWISDRGHDYVARLCDAAQARGEEGRPELARIGARLDHLVDLKERDRALVRRIAWARERGGAAGITKAFVWQVARSVVSFPLSVFNRRRDAEWQTARGLLEGSEMYVCVQRGEGSA